MYSYSLVSSRDRAPGGAAAAGRRCPDAGPGDGRLCFKYYCMIMTYIIINHIY